MDITSTDLRLAFLDQHVEWTYRDRPHAYIAVMRGDGWALGLAVANERGFNPIDGTEGQTMEAAERQACGMNAHINLSTDDVFAITVSTMGCRRYVK